MPHEQPQPRFVLASFQYAQLQSLDTVLAHEDEQNYLQASLRKYQISYSIDRTLLQMFTIVEPFGNYEDFNRTLLRQLYRREEIYAQFDIDKVIPSQASRGFNTLIRAIARHKTIYVDEDTKMILDLLDEDTNHELTTTALLREKLRSQKEEMELMSMQIEYLKNEKRKTYKEKRKRSPKTEPVEVYPSPPEEAALPEPEVSSEPAASPFLLHGWDVLWTERFFSSEPQHLQPISTQSRAEAETDVEKAGRGQISIPAGSIVRALEFYLRKDVIQKALTARNKYVPKDMKDWVKIKRGKDRIMLLLPQEEEQRLIFFAAGRDVIYRGL